MNRKMIGKVLGFILLLECVFLFPSALIAIADGQMNVLRAFIGAMAAALGAGLALSAACRNAEKHFYAREGFLIVGLGWIVLSVVAALPFYLSGEIPRFVDALFEVLGSTNARTLTDLDSDRMGAVSAMIRRYKDFDKETRQTLLEAVGVLSTGTDGALTLSDTLTRGEAAEMLLCAQEVLDFRAGR